MALSVKISLNIHFQTLNSRISSFSFQVKPLKVTISSSTSVIAVSVTEVPALCVIEWSWNIDFFFCGNRPLSSKRRAACCWVSVSLCHHTQMCQSQSCCHSVNYYDYTH